MSCFHCGSDRGRYGGRYCYSCEQIVQKYQRAALRAVREAVQVGGLVRAKLLLCVDCGDQAHDYDHRDYSKPLDVVPVCRSCNLRRGPAAIPELEAA